MNVKTNLQWAMCLMLVTSSGLTLAQDKKSNSSKGEYFLLQSPYDESVCKVITSKLNQFRELDFDTCHPRLAEPKSDFTRPEWTEIPFNIDLAKRLITSTGAVRLWEIQDPTHEKLVQATEAYWQRWLKASESYRASGKARMWTLKVDIEGDGNEETMVRILPGDANLLSAEAEEGKPLRRPLNVWDCPYNQGQPYMLEAKNQKLLKEYQRRPWGSDLVFYHVDAHYYLLHYRKDGVLPQGVTSKMRGIVVHAIYSGSNPLAARGPVPICEIEWVPTKLLRHVPKEWRRLMRTSSK